GELKRIDHPGEVWSAAFLPEGLQVVTGCEKSLGVYDLASGTRTRILEYFPGKVLAVVCSTRSDFVLAGCVAQAGKNAPPRRNWNLQGRADNVAYDTQMTIATLALSPDGKFIASAGGRPREGESPIVVWDVGNGKRQQTFAGHKDFVKSVAFAPDSKR